MKIFKIEHLHKNSISFKRKLLSEKEPNVKINNEKESKNNLKKNGLLGLIILGGLIIIWDMITTIRKHYKI